MRFGERLTCLFLWFASGSKRAVVARCLGKSTVRISNRTAQTWTVMIPSCSRDTAVKPAPKVIICWPHLTTCCSKVFRSEVVSFFLVIQIIAVLNGWNSQLRKQGSTAKIAAKMICSQWILLHSLFVYSLFDSYLCFSSSSPSPSPSFPCFYSWFLCSGPPGSTS